MRMSVSVDVGIEAEGSRAYVFGIEGLVSFATPGPCTSQSFCNRGLQQWRTEAQKGMLSRI